MEYDSTKYLVEKSSFRKNNFIWCGIYIKLHLYVAVHHQLTKDKDDIAVFLADSTYSNVQV